MGLKPTFKQSDVSGKLKRALAAIDKGVIYNLSYLGLECVTIARNLDTYKDQTGNLRSSVGFIVARNGVPVKTDYKKAQTIKGRKRAAVTGDKTGEALALKALLTHSKGWALIVTAGMIYAHAVELKGYDVLSSAEQYAKKKLPGLLLQLKIKIATMK